MNMDQEYMAQAYQYAEEHSRCLRRKVGAVLVSCDGEVLRSANLPVPNPQQCIQEDCLRDLNGIASGQHSDLCRCIHAEIDLLIQCARKGISSDRATVYCTLSPCPNCARALLRSGIARLVFCEEYSNQEYRTIFQGSGVSIDQLDYLSL